MEPSQPDALHQLEVKVDVSVDDNEVSIVMRQTNYTRDEAIESLKRNKSVEASIAEYLGVTKKVTPVYTTNQGIFKTIRDFF